MKNCSGLILGFLFFCSPLSAQIVPLSTLNLSSMEIGWGSPQADKSVERNRMSIAGKQYEHGIGTHAISTFLIHCDGKAKRFSAAVGVDDEVRDGPASLEFVVLADRKVLWRSGVIKKGSPARLVDLPLAGVNYLGLLVTDAGDGIDYDHADWADAEVEFTAPVNPVDLVRTADTLRYILTPPAPKVARINGARVFGVRPGKPLLYTVAVSGERPITIAASGLPAGVTLDEQTGLMRGTIHDTGTYTFSLTAANRYGVAIAPLKIVVGDRIALTPPMGWNSWNCWAEAVDASKVRGAADAMVRSGLIQHGWTYINIDDCWMVRPNSSDSITGGVPRDPDGEINSNHKFPDMKSLSSYVHNAGLKLGIYSSPGPQTCAGFTASYQHEQQDAGRFAEWGIDYLKYDWCSYGSIAKDKSLSELKKPYTVMQAALKDVSRDIVYSLCQYGMGNVWEWGDEVGGNCWRTTGDINDSWSSVAGIGFGQAGHERFAGPGHWNDPDMLVVGNVGWGPQLHPSKLTPDEQYTHISLWCLLSAPLLIGCDLTSLDEFTFGLLSNDEVLAVDQDPLGVQARRVADRDGIQIWVKDMEDGSKAVGVFNVGMVRPSSPEDYFDWEGKPAASVTITADEIGVAKKFIARDLWRQKNIGSYEDRMPVEVRKHGVVLLRITPEQ